ncbi:MAG: hypothetical protein J6328_06425, partial [Bacilli bacterium]|nr:hypothetical protein [Bacilli bacterium]
QNRYRYIQEHGDTRNSNVLVMHSKVTIDGKTYEIDNRIRLSEPSDDEGMKEANEEMLKKVETMSNRVIYYLSCPFMKKMKGAKIVHNPINMTNLLEKNPDYKKCVKLWRFIDSYNKLGIEYNIVERNEEFSKEYMDEVASTMVNNLLTLTAHQVDAISLPLGKGDLNKKITPKTLLNLDDIAFMDGKFQYTQFPEIAERWEEVTKETEAKFKKDHPLQSPSIEEVKKLKEIEKQRRQEEIIYARDIHIRQEGLRERWSRLEDRAQIDKYRRFNSFLDAEAKRLDEIEDKDRAIREEEKKSFVERLNKESAMYEDSLMSEMRKLIEEEASRDRGLEENASYSRSGLPVPKEYQRPFYNGYAPGGEENDYPYYGSFGYGHEEEPGFGFGEPYEQGSSHHGASSYYEQSHYEVMEEEGYQAEEIAPKEEAPNTLYGEATEELKNLISWASEMARKAARLALDPRQRTEKNLVSVNADGSKTYRIEMENVER